jgi:electron transfer flavoprotein beta subunit
MSLPCVIGAGKGLNTPRYAKLSDIMKARKKEVKEIDLDSLNLDTPDGSLEILELKPVIEERKSKILSGEPKEVVKEFVEILTNEGKIF